MQKMSIKFRTAAAGVLAAALLLAGCGDNGSGSETDSDSGAATQAESLTIGTLNVPTSLDPKDGGGSSMPFFQAAYDTLIMREPDGTLVPMLATEWSYNEDRTELTLTIIEGVSFDDRTPLDAEAVKANLIHFRDGNGQSASLAAAIESVDTPDATTVIINLSAPDPGLEWALSDAVGLIGNPSTLGADAITTDPDGTGPYTLNTSETAIGTRWVYDRRDDYWGEALPYSRIVISAFDDENAIVNGLKTGQINTALIQSTDQQMAAEQDPNLTLQPYQFDFFGLLLFDRDGVITPELADVRVRQAINYALDRQTLLDGIRQGQGTITSQVFGTDTDGYQEELDSYYDHDSERARELLQEAGLGDGFTLVLPAIPGVTSDASTTAIATQLAEAGITLEWENPDNPLSAIFTERQFSGMPMNLGQSTSAWNVAQTLVLPGTFNLFGTTTEETQELVTELQNSSGEEYSRIAAELNTYLVEQAWFAPIYRVTNELVTDPSVTAVAQEGMAVPSLYNYTPTGN